VMYSLLCQLCSTLFLSRRLVNRTIVPHGDHERDAPELAPVSLSLRATAGCFESISLTQAQFERFPQLIRLKNADQVRMKSSTTTAFRETRIAIAQFMGICLWITLHSTQSKTDTPMRDFLDHRQKEL
jgi:hypothetical protein